MNMDVFRLSGLSECSGVRPDPHAAVKRVWARPTTTGGGTVYLYAKKTEGSVTGRQSKLAFAWIPAEANPPMDKDSTGQWVNWHQTSPLIKYVSFDDAEPFSQRNLLAADQALRDNYKQPPPILFESKTPNRLEDKREERDEVYYEGRLIPKHLVQPLKNILTYTTAPQRRGAINGNRYLTDMDRIMLRELLHLNEDGVKQALQGASQVAAQTATAMNAIWANAQSQVSQPPTKKAPSIMTKIAQAAQTITINNKTAVIAAGYLEAGRVANSRVSKLIAPRLPMMARGYADTPLGRLVIANLAQVVQQQFRADNVALGKLTSAMVTQAYGEMLANLKIDELLDELLSDKKIAAAMTAAGDEA